MNTIGVKTKRAYNMDFIVTDDTYIPKDKSWEEMAKEEKTRRQPSFKPNNPLRIEVIHKNESWRVDLHGFYVPKNPKEKSVAFISCYGKRWAVKFGSD
ncbi:MAG: hypothetical protein NTY80_00715 [candidate division SR1 bacterium]|nr:hypothetical protein [candidate division SR1 bacterium]